MWAPWLDHQRPWSYCLAGWDIHSWNLESSCKKAKRRPCYEEAQSMWKGHGQQSKLSPVSLFFFILFFKLYNIVLVLPYIEMNPPQAYMCSPSWTLLPPPSPYHPSGLSQCTSSKHPVSCIEPGLVTRFIYDIIHISMPFSQIIPPSPSPTESKRLFYTSVSLAVSYTELLLPSF